MAGDTYTSGYLHELFRVETEGPGSDRILYFRERPRPHFKSDNEWRRWNAQNAGKRVANSGPDSSDPRVTIDGRRVALRRVMIALETGMWPEGKLTLFKRGYRHTGDDSENDDGMAAGFGGALRDALEEACEDEGVTRDEMTVLAVKNDPFRLDTPAGHRDGRWFAAQMASVSAGALTIHLRGLHYQIVARGDVLKPNGEIYVNTIKDWLWLTDNASKAARWLGYVEFGAIKDNRAGEPIIKRRAFVEPEASVQSGFVVALDHGQTLEPVDADEADRGLPTPKLGNFHPRQKYAFAVFGEKSSLFDEVDPVAERLEADLYLETGEQSISHVHDLAVRAAADGRILVVVILADFDPSGRQMATSIARKLRALSVLIPGFEYRVIEAGLTFEQAEAFNLPSTPLKESERRAARWVERFGREQTELDAMLVLHPGELGRAVERAFAPYFDATLNERTREAEAGWREEAEAQIAEACGEATLDLWRSRIAAAIAEIEAVNAEMEAAVVDIDLDPPELPEAEPDDAEEDEGHAVVASSAWSFAEETRRLKARKALEDEDDED